jgi:hypothetical protein
VIADKEICPGSSGGIWNLWWNIQLTDDPEAWDSEIKTINSIQDSLSELTRDQRLIRAQMAEFCREQYLFPESIDILCKEIGDGRFSEPVTMGCEGRHLLNFLDCHDQQLSQDKWKKILTEYVHSLDKWQNQEGPETMRDFKVFGFLGKLTSKKSEFVEKLISAINSEESSNSSVKKLCENECNNIQNEKIFERRPFHCFRCDGCDCDSNMFINAGLLCAGALGEEKSIFDKSRRFTEEYILLYSSIINSWLQEETAKPISSQITPHYITSDIELEIAERVNFYLGQRDEAKEWLTACLLKTIKNNQRWHKRKELLDDHPNATYWFKEVSY